MSSQITQALETRQVNYLAFGSEVSKVELTLGMVRKYIAAPAYDQKTKEQIPISETEAIQFMMLLQARRLDPWDGDAYAVPFWDSRSGHHKWALITAHHAFLKRAEFSPHFDGMESGVIIEVDGEYRDLPGDFVPDTLDGSKVKLSGGWAKVLRKDRKIATYRRAKLSTFQKDFGNWLKDPAGMIVKCAEADALRSAFPSACGGLYIREEMGHTIDVTATAQAEPAERRPELGDPRVKTVGPGPTPRAKKPLPQPSPERAPETASAASNPAAATSGQPEPGSQGNEAQQAGTVNPEPPETNQEGSGEQGQGETGGTTPNEGEGTGESTQTQEQRPAEDLPPFKPNPQESDALQSVRLMMHRQGISEAAVMAWARKNQLAKEGQRLADLASKKIENINASWSTVLPKIREFVAQG